MPLLPTGSVKAFISQPYDPTNLPEQHFIFWNFYVFYTYSFINSYLLIHSFNNMYWVHTRFLLLRHMLESQKGQIRKSLYPQAAYSLVKKVGDKQ